jgi:hypothetical protein
LAETLNLPLSKLQNGWRRCLNTTLCWGFVE